jgi:hypothetical protein
VAYVSVTVAAAFVDALEWGMDASIWRPRVNLECWKLVIRNLTMRCIECRELHCLHLTPIEALLAGKIKFSVFHTPSGYIDV